MIVPVVYGILGGAGFATFVAAVGVMVGRGYGRASAIGTERPGPLPTAVATAIHDSSPVERGV